MQIIYSSRNSSGLFPCYFVIKSQFLQFFAKFPHVAAPVILTEQPIASCNFMINILLPLPFSDNKRFRNTTGIPEPSKGYRIIILPYLCPWTHPAGCYTLSCPQMSGRALPPWDPSPQYSSALHWPRSARRRYSGPHRYLKYCRLWAPLPYPTRWR